MLHDNVLWNLKLTIAEVSKVVGLSDNVRQKFTMSDKKLIYVKHLIYDLSDICPTNFAQDCNTKDENHVSSSTSWNRNNESVQLIFLWLDPYSI